jgi:hypothetical protein
MSSTSCRRSTERRGQAEGRAQCTLRYGSATAAGNPKVRESTSSSERPSTGKRPRRTRHSPGRPGSSRRSTTQLASTSCAPPSISTESASTSSAAGRTLRRGRAAPCQRKPRAPRDTRVAYRSPASPIHPRPSRARCTREISHQRRRQSLGVDWPPLTALKTRRSPAGPTSRRQGYAGPPELQRRRKTVATWLAPRRSEDARLTRVGG